MANQRIRISYNPIRQIVYTTLNKSTYHLKATKICSLIKYNRIYFYQIISSKHDT